MKEFIKTVRSIAKDGWGTNVATDQEAKRKMLDTQPVGIVEAAALEIVLRLNQVIEALAGGQGKSEPWYSPENKRPDDARKIDGLRVGDRLYFINDLEDGGGEKIVAAFDSDGFPMTCYTKDISEPHERVLRWIDEDYHRTIAAAVRQQAEQGIDYYSKRLELAKAALRDVESGADLSKYMEGVDLDATNQKSAD